jgi:hypothetical protein
MRKSEKFGDTPGFVQSTQSVHQGRRVPKFFPGSIVRKLALILALFLAAAPAFAVTKKPAKKKATHKKHYRAPVVRVSPKVRQMAFQAVSARAEQQSSALEGGGGLVAFFEQISHPPPAGSLHILHFGDSHTASDDWADAMRQAFQR